MCVFHFSVESTQVYESKKYTVNFNEVKVKEFIKFVSKICSKNFIFKDEQLNFNVSFISGKASSKEGVLEALKHILFQHNFKVIDHDEYFVIEKMSDEEAKNKLKALKALKNSHLSKSYLQSVDVEKKRVSHNGRFHFYKLQYHVGSELIKIIKQVAASQIESQPEFVQAINSLQWIDSTNSLVFSSDNYLNAEEVIDLIKSLDKPQKQVFIEILVLETSLKDGMEFGLEWAGKGHVDNKLGFGFGNFQDHSSSLAHSLKSLKPGKSLDGSHVPLGRGFDLGVIGDLIFHKGRTFINLASLVSALQRDGKATIILNQKILTQDNKISTIFVGDNIPFTGSVVETIGAAQQTTSNIEYRDVGVSLHITPLLGDSDVITLDIKEEITEAREDLQPIETRTANGIVTSKTNMVTRAHVPDKNFLVLSGMVKNAKVRRKTGIPCLGSLPLIGAAFSKTKVNTEKKNIIVFVRPQIIHNFEEYNSLSYKQEKEFEKELDPKDFRFQREEK